MQKARSAEHGGKSKTVKKQSAKTGESESKELDSLTVACCLVPVACFHLMTLSALASTFGGIVRPICLVP